MVEPAIVSVKDTGFIRSINNGVAVSVSERRITKSTMEKYGVVRDNGKYFFPYYDSDGTLVAAKTRPVDKKEFATAGKWKEGTLFGQNLHPSGGLYR